MDANPIITTWRIYPSGTYFSPEVMYARYTYLNNGISCLPPLSASMWRYKRINVLWWALYRYELDSTPVKLTGGVCSRQYVAELQILHAARCYYESLPG